MLATIPLALALFAAAVSAGPALSVSLTGAPSVTTRANSVVVATVTNTGDEVVKVLNHPRTMLSKLPTDIFAISSDEGNAPRFHGVFAKYILSPNKPYTTIEPGKSVTVNHSLADAYDFGHSGAGTYKIEPSPTFYVVVDGGVKTLTADVTPHSAVLSGALVQLGNTTPVSIISEHCSEADLDTIRVAALGADSNVFQSMRVLLTRGNERLILTWWGAYETPRYSVILSRYAGMANIPFAYNVTYSCAGPATCAGAEGYTGQFARGYISLCPTWFTYPLTRADSQAGILINLATSWAGDIAPTEHWRSAPTTARCLRRKTPTPPSKTPITTSILLRNSHRRSESPDWDSLYVQYKHRQIPMNLLSVW